MLEHHDVTRVETVGIGWGRRNDGSMRRRIEAAFTRFVDATNLSDAQVAALLRESNIDIAVDLMGHTHGQRTGVFALRGAPLQVAYLGFPGTTGAPYMDYVIGDSVVIPAGEDAAYSERVVRLPHCCLPTDDRRSIAAEPPTRAAAGLPPTGFVFCAFNNAAKITRDLFAVWMRLLQAVPGSVLWLRTPGEDARGNLQREARQLGIEPQRLVFADAVPMEEHLARQRLADLFLDTLPYNAHATACDALWAGLPVLTCRGKSFAGRVGASLLLALGLVELVAESIEDYQARALEFGATPRPACRPQGEACRMPHRQSAVRYRAVHAPPGSGLCRDDPAPVSRARRGGPDDRGRRRDRHRRPGGVGCASGAARGALSCCPPPCVPRGFIASTNVSAEVIQSSH